MRVVRTVCLGIALLVTASGLLTAAESAAPAKPAAAAPTNRVDERPWPRTFDEGGLSITLHAPQLDQWQGNQLTGRIAVAVRTGTKTGDDGKPHDAFSYGAMWFNARTETDKVERTVRLVDVGVDKVSFPTDRANEAKYTDLLKRIADRGDGKVVSLSVLESSLAITRETKSESSVAVKNDPPDILFSFTPALLVLVDGNPVLKPSGTAGVERVVNTRSLLVRQGGTYYLAFAGRWVSASDLAGPWTEAKTVPPAVDQVKTSLAKSKLVDLLDQPSDALKKSLASGTLPAVYVRTKPSELVMIDGDPDFVDIDGTQLAYVSNSASDVFIDRSHDNFWYVLISGRWFGAESSNGPWTYVPGNGLPGDFAKIPPDSAKSAVLASVPGTPEARESLIANSIPQTATVKKSQASLKVDYDGTPDFKPIDGTPMSYAWNTATPVIKAETAYYAVQNGIWFMGASPDGPWVVAASVPPVIYSIPASSPLHYVTYVRVYGDSGDDVYVGYTPGYYGTVVSDGVVVYGTGYSCNPWIGAYWYGCPATYGFNVAFGYDPWVGWTFGYAWGAAWASAWYGPWWGPWGYWGYPGYWPGYWGGGIATANIYGRWGHGVVAGVGAAWANPWTGNYGRAARGRYTNEMTGGRGAGYAARNTNAYTGTTRAAAGGMRYNPQTGRVVAGQGAAAGNPYTGNAVAGGSRTAVNTNTGRVTQSGGVAGRTDAGAAAAGGFSTDGARGDAKGAGYVNYNRATGEVNKGGVVDINDQMYAGRNGNVYKYDQGQGWQQVGDGGHLNKATDLPAAGNLDGDRFGRERGIDRDFDRTGGFSRNGGFSGGSRQFDRGSFGGDFQGRMGGFRQGGGMGGFGGGGGRRR